MRKHRADSQVNLVLEHLKTGSSIEPMEALSRYGIYRLGACIGVLREEGYPIETEIIYFKRDNGRKGHYAKYTMVVHDDGGVRR